VTKRTHQQDMEDQVDPPQDDLVLEITRWRGGVGLAYRGDENAPVPATQDVPSAPGERTASSPADSDTLTDWCCDPTVSAEAERRVAMEGATASELALCRVLLAMWQEAGRKNGTVESIRKIRRSRN
jgi:hypothetical protein